MNVIFLAVLMSSRLALSACVKMVSMAADAETVARGKALGNTCSQKILKCAESISIVSPCEWALRWPSVNSQNR